MTESNDSDGERWSRPQHAVAYAEARAVLNAQQQRKNNLDDKALRTTRLATVIVGAVITALGTLGIDIRWSVGFVGIGLLIVSFVGPQDVHSSLVKLLLLLDCGEHSPNKSKRIHLCTLGSFTMSSRVSLKGTMGVAPVASQVDI